MLFRSAENSLHHIAYSHSFKTIIWSRKENMPDSGANLCFELSYFQILDNLCRYSFFKLIELKLILLNNIKPIKYKSDNIIIDEIKEIM